MWDFRHYINEGYGVCYVISILNFAIVLNAALGDKIKNPYGSAIILVFVIIILSWGGIARLVRGKVLQEKENEYFLAAQSIGTPTYKIILKHLLNIFKCSYCTQH